ncbi:hypothetical protein [Agromyces humi]|uniref:hypothetical protein n=1 Tax=Agromyces humi TaxID=1766800 RepID=UPI001357E655|nr:hypothetical protein [Agromyces humi]
MTLFSVTYTAEVEASSPREAAELAAAGLLEGAPAAVFDVEWEDEGGTSVCQLVDLEEDEALDAAV